MKEPVFLDGDIALARIEALVGRARAVWLVMLGFLAFITLTLFSVQDIDFFSIASATKLPIVDIEIPSTTFFIAASMLATILHTYFHLFLLKLWDALAEAPLHFGKIKLGDRTYPWLVADWALSQHRDKPVSERPLDSLAAFVVKRSNFQRHPDCASRILVAIVGCSQSLI
ncbi:MAG: hypothetical protein R3C97_02220 [Geminicoccaceae bacterium]